MYEDVDEAVDLGPEPAVQTIDQFIARVIEAARNREDFDATLLAILTKNIVKQVPADDAVVLAANQIEALADKRVSRPEKEPSDGGDNA